MNVASLVLLRKRRGLVHQDALAPWRGPARLFCRYDSAAESACQNGMQNAHPLATLKQTSSPLMNQ